MTVHIFISFTYLLLTLQYVFCLLCSEDDNTCKCLLCSGQSFTSLFAKFNKEIVVLQQVA